EALRDAIEDDGQNDDAEAAFEAEADLEALDTRQHRLAEAAGADHRGDDDHGQRQHDGLVHAGHDRGHGQRQLDLEEQLPVGAAEGETGFDVLYAYLADAEIGQANDRRHGEDERGNGPRDLSQPKEHHG